MIGRLWRENRWAVMGFVIALTLSGFFGGRLALRAVYWSDPAHFRQTPEGWMTPGYLERSWHLPPRSLGRALRDPGDGKPRPGHTLAEIAAARDIPLEDLLARVSDALAAEAARAPRPGAPPPPDAPPPDAPPPDATLPDGAAPDASPDAAPPHD